MRQATIAMSSRSGRSLPPPDKDSVTYVFMPKSGGIPYSITVPWVTIRDDVCYLEATTIMASLSEVASTPQPLSSISTSTTNNITNTVSSILISSTSISVPSATATSIWDESLLNPFTGQSQTFVKDYHLRVPYPKLYSLGLSNFRGNAGYLQLDHPNWNSFNAVFGADIPASAPANLSLKDTSFSSIKWAIYKPESKNMGIVYMYNFAPYGNVAIAATQMISEILV